MKIEYLKNFIPTNNHNTVNYNTNTELRTQRFSRHGTALPEWTIWHIQVSDFLCTRQWRRSVWVFTQAHIWTGSGPLVCTLIKRYEIFQLSWVGHSTWLRLESLFILQHGPPMNRCWGQEPTVVLMSASVLTLNLAIKQPWN